MIRLGSFRDYTLMSIKLALACLEILFTSACQVGVSQTPQTLSSQNTEEAISDVEFEVGPGTFFLADPLAGLNELSGYTATLTQSFDGTVSGEDQLWTDTYVMMRDNITGAMQMTVSTVDSSSQSSVFLAEIGDISYQITRDFACYSEMINAEISSIERTDPAGKLSIVLGADEAGQEEMNGISAIHYTFDERALGKAGLEVSTGEIWVAADDGFILNYTLTTTGGDTAFGEGIEGTMTWDYTLSDVNATVLPPLPEGCQLNAPVMADATNLIHTGYWLSFSTSATVADATAFYQAQLPGMGWTLSLGPATGEQSTLTEYTQGDQTIGVSIIAGAEGTDVNVVLYYPDE